MLGIYCSDYNIFSAARTNKKGGGVALYIRDVYDCKLITTNSIAIDNILECVTVDNHFEKQKTHQLLVFTEPQVKIYRHSEITSCLLLTMFPGMANSLFVATLILIHESEDRVRQFLDSMYALGLYPLITKPTRITPTTAGHY